MEAKVATSAPLYKAILACGSFATMLKSLKQSFNHLTKLHLQVLNRKLYTSFFIKTNKIEVQASCS